MDSQRRKESGVREMKGFRNRNKKTSADFRMSIYLQVKMVRR
jgi:hypothetical protein